MTELSFKNVKCSCGRVSRIIYHSSINAQMCGESALLELLDGTHGTKNCEYCGKSLRVVVEVLINGPKGSFTILNTEDSDTIKESFIRNGINPEYVSRVGGGFERRTYSLRGPPPLTPEEEKLLLDKLKIEDKGIKDRNYGQALQIKPSRSQAPPPLNLNDLSEEEKKRINEKNLSPSDKQKLEEYWLKKKKREFSRFK